ncbi:glycoside hydrolase family protein [Kribbella sp. NPDC056345]|uniref:glycoside hydrolase family protein n=1 Tax=Kribbella sp. NPDC056345 TaxID=3345789 RepID=UPI0035D965FB
MRKLVLLFLPVLLSFTLAAPSQAATSKKGVSTNNVSGASQALSAVGASWFYSWATNPQGVAKPAGVEFVPMIWGRGSVNSAALNDAKANGSTLLGFNEPDMAGQANMSVDEALNLWPQLQATGMRLGAPAVAYGGDVPGGWLDRFMAGAAQRGYRVDFIPIHWYGSDFSTAATGHLENYVNAVRARYNKPVWVTEYALVDWSTGTARFPSEAQQVDFIKRSTAMLAGKSFVERFAWFTLSTQVFPTGLYNGATPNASGTAYRTAQG